VEIVRCQITEQPFIHALLKQAGLRLIVWLGLIEPSFSVQPTRWVRGERWIFPLALGAVTHDAGHQLIERRDFSSEHQLECFGSRTFRNSARVLAPPGFKEVVDRTSVAIGGAEEIGFAARRHRVPSPKYRK